MISNALSSSPLPFQSFRDVDTISNRYDAYMFLRRFAAEHRFRYFGVLNMPPEATTRLAEHLDVSNSPEPFLRRYDEAGMLSDSPTFAALRGSVRPFAWTARSASVRRNVKETGRAEELFQQFGLVKGCILPVHDRLGQRGAVGLFGDRAEPDIDELAYMAMIGASLFERMRDVDRTPEAATQARLSARERQCLMWTAAGKTSAEMGGILGLSEHTVNQYITGACQKLGTVNRTQAVATAIRRKLID